MKWVYLVSSGEYSDYTIHAVYSTREAADECAVRLTAEKQTHGDPASVEAYELDPVCVTPKPEYRYWQVIMSRDGTATPTSSDHNLDDRFSHDIMGSDYLIRPDRDRPGANCLCVYRWAADAMTVVKIASEIRARMIAEGEWPESP